MPRTTTELLTELIKNLEGQIEVFNHYLSDRDRNVRDMALIATLHLRGQISGYKQSIKFQELENNNG